ncbi:MAG: hypothetical protein KF809_14870 [Chloroflexi bacterium]|nr:hypothetical protein [Chloroflexota bacterium]
MTATLRDKPGPFPRSVTLVLDCPHGQTRGVLVNGTERTRRAAIDAIAERHELEERCGCTATLRPIGTEARA